jgi:hypothetical protein
MSDVADFPEPPFDLPQLIERWATLAREHMVADYYLRLCLRGDRSASKTACILMVLAEMFARELSSVRQQLTYEISNRGAPVAVALAALPAMDDIRKGDFVIVVDGKVVLSNRRDKAERAGGGS